MAYPPNGVVRNSWSKSALRNLARFMHRGGLAFLMRGLSRLWVVSAHAGFRRCWSAAGV